MINWNHYLTIESQLSFCYVLPSWILSHAFIQASILLLKIGDFKNPIWLVSSGFGCYRLSISSSPDNSWYWTGGEKKREWIMLEKLSFIWIYACYNPFLLGSKHYIAGTSQCSPKVTYSCITILISAILSTVMISSTIMYSMFSLGIEPRSPTLQADSLPVEPPGKPLKSNNLS